MQLTGRTFVTVKGQRLRSKDGATLKNFGGLSREGVTADTGVAGYTEKTEIPEIECTIAHGADTKLSDFLSITDETISFDTDTGSSYILTGAWCTGALELSKGEVKLKFQGMDCQEA